MTHWLVIVVSCALSAALTPLVRRLAVAAGAVDVPGDRKIHTVPVPRLGGIAVAFAAASGTVLALTIAPLWSPPLLVFDPPVAWVSLAGGTALVFLVGLWDDLRPLPAAAKLVVEIVAATWAVSHGVVMEHVTVMGETTNLGWLAGPLTVAWIVVITNAFNLIDGLDGLATGLGIIACGTCATLLVLRGDPATALPLVALLGAALGFLPYNFSPASIFLGDSGSLVFGYVLAVTAITGWQKGATALAVGGPVLAMALPILDTATSVIRRLPDLRRLLVADQRHIHHQLVWLGLSQRRAVLVLYVIALGCSALALATSQFP